MDNVKLEYAKDDATLFDALYIYKRMERNGEYIGNEKRLKNGKTFVIKYNGASVGVITASPELRYNAAFFVDMNILADYQNMGIGTIALEKFIDCFKGNPRFLIGQVSADNTLSNSVCLKIGYKILDGDMNYYLLQKERINEFLEFNQDHEFERSMGRNAYDGALLAQELLKEEDNKKR